MRLKVFFCVLMLLMLNGALLFAQGTTTSGLPCVDTDVDNPCPLDTWVFVLAAVLVVFASVNLYYKKSSLTR